MRHAIAWLAGAFLVVSALSGCPPQGAPCVTDATCGEQQACLKEVCQDVTCRSDVQCPLETTCNLETYTCDAGCTTSADCFVGDRCDVTLGECVPRSCDDTQLDCDFGERCDPQTGECFVDAEPHCKRCFSDNECGTDGLCARVSANSVDRCFLPCVPEAADPCPSGMQCTRTSDEMFRCIGFCDGL